MNRPSTFNPSATLSTANNKVLRNTYWLLSLSMIPTMLGAWLGVQLKFSIFGAGMGIGFIAFLAISFGFIMAIQKHKDSVWGLALLFGFTLFMGLMLATLLGRVLGHSNGASLIMLAFGGTAALFAVMASIATVSKQVFHGLGKWLFAGMLVILIAGVANIFLNIPALHLTISVIAIAIFSAYILYDVQQIIHGGETNYITATLTIYLSIYNIFSNLLSLLEIFGGSD